MEVIYLLNYKKMNRNEAELKFWVEHLKTAKTDYEVKQVYPEFARFINEKIGRDCGVLDLGSGAYNTLGNRAGDIVLGVVCTDLLAKEYAELMHPKFCEVLYADMRDLKFTENRFKVVHCSNALDHCEEPFVAIKEMERVGEWVFLRHFKNVGKIEQYQGMHEFDIYMNDDGKMVISDRGGNMQVYPEYTCWIDDKFIYAFKCTS